MAGSPGEGDPALAPEGMGVGWALPFPEGSTCLPSHLSQVWGSRGQGPGPTRPLPPPPWPVAPKLSGLAVGPALHLGFEARSIWREAWDDGDEKVRLLVLRAPNCLQASVAHEEGEWRLWVWLSGA